jgi:hypothetical protein
MPDDPQLIDVFIDFMSNSPRTDQTREMISQQFRERFERLLPEKVERVWDLLPLAVREPAGDYLDLLVEARGLYVDGHFYACVAMCGITAERLVKDVLRRSVLVEKGDATERPSESAFDQLERVEVPGIVQFLSATGLLDPKAAGAAKRLLELRNQYAHARGKDPEADAAKAIASLQTVVEGTVSLFRDYDIRDGRFVRKPSPPERPDDA